jgi:hypothetical protein
MKKNYLFFALAATFLKSVFIPQFASGQNPRLWATYYGGTGTSGCDNSGHGVATDAADNVFLAGYTQSPNNIASAGGFKNTLGGAGYNAFLAKFDANGNRLWATYYGGLPMTAPALPQEDFRTF